MLLAHSWCSDFDIWLCLKRREDDLATDGFDASIKGDASTGDYQRSVQLIFNQRSWRICLHPPYAATKAVPRLISKGSSSVLTYPHVDVGAMNEGFSTLISVNDASSMVL
jgi:hypothetical protein